MYVFLGGTKKAGRAFPPLRGGSKSRLFASLTHASPDPRREAAGVFFLSFFGAARARGVAAWAPRTQGGCFAYPWFIFKKNDKTSSAVVFFETAA